MKEKLNNLLSYKG